MALEVTVGIDIGTTSGKAVAVDADGRVVAHSRVGHELLASHAGELAHPAEAAWHDGVIEALALLQAGSSAEPLAILGVDVAAMVPSLCAVDGAGHPISPGLLYGDERGAGAGNQADGTSGELVRFLEWLVQHHPDAAGFWPAQAVANAALSGIGAIDTVVAYTTMPLFDLQGWDAAVAAAAGVDDVRRLPVIVSGADAVGRVEAAGGALLGGGTIDALGEQLVAGADGDGDVLVILGSTLIVWAVAPSWREVDGLWTVPHTAPGKVLMGGPSNAGGLFVNWVGRTLGVDLWKGGPRPDDPARVPVWQPYLRGERVPFHDPGRRASLHDLDIGMDPWAIVRAAYEASGFAARHQLDLSGLTPNRIVATGGGVRDAAWVQAVADATGLPVDVVAVPEGGALGAAWLARQTAGLEPPGSPATRWVRTDHRVEPDARWQPAVDARYARYRELAG
ncbi:MAG: xylulokinase [Acidimicrobiales bacterium]